MKIANKDVPKPVLMVNKNFSLKYDFLIRLNNQLQIVTSIVQINPAMTLLNISLKFNSYYTAFLKKVGRLYHKSTI